MTLEQVPSKPPVPTVIPLVKLPMGIKAQLHRSPKSRRCEPSRTDNPGANTDDLTTPHAMLRVVPPNRGLALHAGPPSFAVHRARMPSCKPPHPVVRSHPVRRHPGVRGQSPRSCRPPAALINWKHPPDPAIYRPMMRSATPRSHFATPTPYPSNIEAGNQSDAACTRRCVEPNSRSPVAPLSGRAETACTSCESPTILKSTWYQRRATTASVCLAGKGVHDASPTQ
jgi:hypothetical protein